MAGTVTTDTSALARTKIASRSNPTSLPLPPAQFAFPNFSLRSPTPWTLPKAAPWAIPCAACVIGMRIAEELACRRKFRPTFITRCC